MAFPHLRIAVLGLPLLIASCGPQAREDENAVMADCGPPSANKFHSAHLIMSETGPLPYDITDHWADGCAIISFQLDSAGKLIDPAIELERPEGGNAGDLAIAVLQRDAYAPNPEKSAETPAPDGADTRYAITVGFGQENGHLVLAKRTVTKRPLPSDNL